MDHLMKLRSNKYFLVWTSQESVDVRRVKKYWTLEIPIGTMIIIYRRALEVNFYLLFQFLREN